MCGGWREGVGEWESCSWGKVGWSEGMVERVEGRRRRVGKIEEEMAKGRQRESELVKEVGGEMGRWVSEGRRKRSSKMEE